MMLLNTVWDQISAILDTVLGFIPVLPKIPHLDIDLSDLVSPSADLINRVKQALADRAESFINYLKSLMPIPLLGSISSPDIDLPQIITTMISGYMNKVMESLSSLMARLKEAAEKILEFSISIPLPEIPAIPSVQDMVDYIKGKIQIPVFSFSFPLPLTPNANAPDIDVPQLLATMYQDMNAYVMNLVGGFISSIYNLIPGAPPLPRVRATLDILNPEFSVEVLV